MPYRTTYVLPTLLLLAVVAFDGCLAADGFVRSETDTVIVPGSPSGEVSDGNLLSAPNKRMLLRAGVSSWVTRVRIEQSDYVVPEVGRNPNQVIYDGPGTSIPAQINLTGINSVRFTVWVSGRARVASAVRFEWAYAR